MNAALWAATVLAVVESPLIDQIEPSPYSLIAASAARPLWADELQMTDGQIRKVEEQRLPWLKKVREFRAEENAMIALGAPDEEVKRFQERTERILLAEQKRIGDVLLRTVYIKQQLRTIVRLTIQERLAYGIAFLDPDLVRVLQLTKEQSKRMEELRLSISSYDMPEDRELRFSLENDIRRRQIMEVLDDQQREKLFELIGEPNPQVLMGYLLDVLPQRGSAAVKR